MNKFLTFFFCLILLLAPITGCLEETTPEDEPAPPEDDTTPIPDNVNETGENTGGGSDTSGDNGGSGDNSSPNTPDVNETDGNTGGDGDTGDNSGDSGDNTNNPNQNQTDDSSGGGETDPGDNSGGGETDPGGDPDDGNGNDITVGNTTECDTGESGFAFSIIQFDITNHPNFVNIGGLEIECSSNILYGFAWDNVAEVEHFISIDPSNGLVTSLAEITGIELVTSHSTFGNGEYFAIMRGGGTIYLVQISTSNSFSITMTEFDYSNHPELANTGGIEYDHTNDILYGYAFDDSNSGSGQPAQPGQPMQPGDPPLAYVVTIDPSNGMVAKYTEIEDIEGIADGASAYDGQSYYLNVRNTGGGYSMAKIDVSDFSISMSSVLSSTNEDLTSPSGFEVNVVTGIIYGYAWDSVNEEEVFISYEIDSESITQIGVITGITLVTTTSTQEGVDFYAIMADSSKQNFLVHIQY